MGSWTTSLLSPMRALAVQTLSHSSNQIVMFLSFGVFHLPGLFNQTAKCRIPTNLSRPKSRRYAIVIVQLSTSMSQFLRVANKIKPCKKTARDGATWYSHEKLDSVSKSVETELGVRHRAVRNKRPRSDLLTDRITVHPDHSARAIPNS